MSAPADAGPDRAAARPAAGDGPAVEGGSGAAGQADDPAGDRLRDELRRLAAEGILASEGRLEPPPLTEIPPHDRYCDLVLTGGVASGVAYPWAVVELARHYRFRQIGGTSVGAVAAALAAASEYGRCMNVTAPFEVMRQVPLELAAPSPAGQPTTLLGLFQPAPGGRRLFRLLVELLTLMRRDPQARPDPARAKSRPWWQRLLLRVLHAGPARRVADAPDGTDPDSDALKPDGLRPLTSHETLGFALRAARAYLPDAVRLGWRQAVVLGVRFLRRQPVPALIAGLVLLGLAMLPLALATGIAGMLLGIGSLAILGLGLIQALQHDLRAGIVDNDMGLCRGLRLPGSQDPGIVDWLHEGIQRAAGLRVGDAPLTFRDLWDAPRPFPTATEDRHIRLEVMVTNITLGRPYRFPLEADGDRLWYVPADWAGFFPRPVLEALERASTPYRPRSDSDPADPGVKDARELPVADLPIVVAARMSMSFPILFSCVPVYAMDYEAPVGRRRLRRCQLSDGGLCSNFPIHLFDAAIPRWPTFGLWLTRRLKDFPDQGVWLPRTHLEGRADSFRDHLDRPVGATRSQPVADLARFGLGVLSTMKDWADHTRIRLPHVRNRVARIRLRPGEGELFITMPADVIRRMAWTYGTDAGRKLVAAFGADPQTGAVATAWRDHLYVRLQVLLVGLRELLKGVEGAAASRAHTLPLKELLQRASTEPVALAGRENRADPAGRALRPVQVSKLEDALAALAALEAELGRTAAADLPYRPSPQPELRLRPPL